MHLVVAADLYCQIDTTVRSVFNKKIGKAKGLDRVGKEIKDIAEENAKAAFGDDLDQETLDALDEFVDTRLGYIKKSFRKLNNPQTNTSNERVELIDQTESDAAKWFGQTKGHEARDDGAYKVWVTLDPCEECASNEAEGPIPVDEDFSSGDYAPPAHPGCVCDLEYVDENGDPLE